MKSLPWAAWLIFMSWGAGAGVSVPQQAKPGSPYVERGQRQFSFHPGGKIQITAGPPGAIEIRGWDQPAVAIESESIVYYLPQNEAKALVEKYPLRLRYGQTSATIKTEGPPRDSSLEVNLKLRIPRQKTDLQIALFKGDLVISNINGWVEANLAQGDVEAASMQGYFSAITKEGDLSLEMSGKRWQGQGLTAYTHRGSAELRLPITFSAALQLETRDGNISVDYPEQVVEGEKLPLHALVKGKARSLTATVGEGGAPIRIYTAAGNIRLSAIHE